MKRLLRLRSDTGIVVLRALSGPFLFMGQVVNRGLVKLAYIFEVLEIFAHFSDPAILVNGLVAKSIDISWRRYPLRCTLASDS